MTTTVALQNTGLVRSNDWPKNSFEQITPVHYLHHTGQTGL